MGRVFESPRARSNFSKAGRAPGVTEDDVPDLISLGAGCLDASAAPRKPRQSRSRRACRIIRLTHQAPRIANDSPGLFQIRRASLGKSPPDAQLLLLKHSSYCRRRRHKILSALRRIFRTGRHATGSRCSDELLIGGEEVKSRQ